MEMVVAVTDGLGTLRGGNWLAEAEPSAAETSAAETSAVGTGAPATTSGKRQVKTAGVTKEGSEATLATSTVDLEQLTDGQLMAEVCKSNEEAFAVLMGRHKGVLVNYLTKLVRCRDRAEDLAQETFVRLFQTAPRYHEQGAFSGFLFRIATNLVRSEERRKRRWTLLMPMLTHQEAAVAEVEDRVDRRQKVAVVRSALLELPLRYRSPVILREIEGWSYAEIAQALGCREGTVKSRIHRGKNDLRRLLKKAGQGILA